MGLPVSRANAKPKDRIPIRILQSSKSTVSLLKNKLKYTPKVGQVAMRNERPNSRRRYRYHFGVCTSAFWICGDSE